MGLLFALNMKKDINALSRFLRINRQNALGLYLVKFTFYNIASISLQGCCARTTTAVGPNPAWNQQLSLSFKSPNNDFSADTLSRVKDSLHLHLFDEVF